ncbi:MAG: ribosome small subunit-dependent GTPase A [Bacteroidota bacterium]
MANSNLKALGWDQFFEDQLGGINIPEFTVGRIIAENKTNYEVITSAGEFIGEATGKLLFSATSSAELPKTGDWVTVTPMSEDRVIVHQVLKRKTILSRKAVGRKTQEQIICTNLDVLFIVQGLDNNYNIARLERYVAAADEGIQPVIILNKADLCHDVHEKAAAIESRLKNVPVLVTSSLEGDLSPVAEFIEAGRTYAFVGSSGVGKSTIINRLLESKIQRTTDVRSKDSRGRHTTTRREMFALPGGALVIDTPGMREFQPWADDTALAEAFAEIDALASSCRFADCQHLEEDHCAVKQAVEGGIIPQAQYQNFLKMKRELDYLQSQTDVLKSQQRKKKVKQQQRELNRMLRKKNKK